MIAHRHLLRALDMLTQGQQAPVPQTLKTAAESLRKEAKPWTAGKGIQGLGIGARNTDGVDRDELALKVYVDRKLPKAQVANLVPKMVRIPDLDDGIETDVEAIGRIKLEANTGRTRPAIPGYGVGHPRVSVGTFGCLVRKTGKRTLYVLSNSHVLADSGLAASGDDTLQPGTNDGGAAPGDVIGILEEWVPFQFGAYGFPNLVDAAIAKVKKSAVTSRIYRLGVPTGVSTRVRRGTRVQKTGRTTDHTVGVVRDVNFRTAINYDTASGRKARAGFQDQVLCTRYTAGGDSGSAVCSMTGKVVGLHFAGSDSSSIFNKIRHVMAALDIEIVTTAF